MTPGQGFLCVWTWQYSSFSLAYNFWTVSPRALIFHISTPIDKTFPGIPVFFLPCNLDLGCGLLFENSKIVNYFSKWVLELSSCTFMSISSDRYQYICPCEFGNFWNWSLFHKHILFFFLFFYKELAPCVLFDGQRFLW